MTRKLSYILQTGAIMVRLWLLAIAPDSGNIHCYFHPYIGFAAEGIGGMFTRIQKFFSNPDRFGSTSLVTRLANDVNILQKVSRMSLRLLIRAPWMSLFALGIKPELASINAVAFLCYQLSFIPSFAVGIGIENPVIGTDLQMRHRSDGALFKKAPAINIFAEVEPDQK